jgi:hypothetical protein
MTLPRGLWFMIPIIKNLSVFLRNFNNLLPVKIFRFAKNFSKRVTKCWTLLLDEIGLLLSDRWLCWKTSAAAIDVDAASRNGGGGVLSQGLFGLKVLVLLDADANRPS